jgi:hypothetical protein
VLSDTAVFEPWPVELFLGQSLDGTSFTAVEQLQEHIDAFACWLCRIENQVST